MGFLIPMRFKVGLFQSVNADALKSLGTLEPLSMGPSKTFRLLNGVLKREWIFGKAFKPIGATGGLISCVLQLSMRFFGCYS